MAQKQKTVGAYITLDGEKEFKSAVTNCNKSLTSLKSEMGLVKAESEGQANSLEALQKKHTVLGKILDEQKQKESEITKALDHAQESYNAVGGKLQQYKTDLKAAQDKLEEMKKSSESTADELQEQEKVVKDLSTAVEKGEQVYQKAGGRIKDWETKLNTAKAQTIKANVELNKNAALMKEAEESTDKCAKSIDEFGKQVEEAKEVTISYGTVIKTNLINTATDFAKSVTGEALSGVTQLESAQQQLQASTGASAAEMKKYRSVMDDIYSNNYGDSMDSVARSMAMVRQYTNEIDPDKLKQMTENGIAMDDVFGMDLSETIRGVNSLVTNMGLSSEEAFDLMAKGAQNGLDKSGELADNITEYGQLWGQAGFSAKEMFAILDNGLESGAYNLDKVNDFVKEFTISLSDGRIEQNLGSFSTGTQKLFREFQSGKATARDVFYSVIDDLSKTENQQKALTIASTTWSALGEDNAMKVITSLGKVNTKYDDVKGTMESIKDIKYDTLESKYEQLGRSFQKEVIRPILKDFLPVAEKGVELLTDNLDKMKPLVLAVGTGFATWKVASTIEGVVSAVKGMKSATEGATTAQKLYNVVANANPYVLLATAVAGVTTALVAYASEAGEASREAQMLADASAKVTDSANQAADATNAAIAAYADNGIEIQAQAEYADTLVGKIEDLAKVADGSNAETKVMKGYIAELNQLVPDLNLAYDDQAKKLNKTNEEIRKKISLNKEEIEMQAAQEYAIDLIKQKTDLEIEQIKLKSQQEDLQGKVNDLFYEENDIMASWKNLAIESVEPVTAMLFGLEDQRETYKTLTEAQEENATALQNNKNALEALDASEDVVNEKLGQYNITVDANTVSMTDNAGAITAHEQALSGYAGIAADIQTASIETAQRVAEDAQAITDTYNGMQQTVAGVLESQMDMFSKFDGGTKLSTDQLLSNMQSQLDGVSNWADNIATLADRGINQNLLTYLSELGPEGAGYVQTFVDMSTTELREASDKWSESLKMKEGVNESVQGMLESYTTAINTGKGKVEDAMKSVGADTVAGLVNEMNARAKEVEIAADGIGQTAVDSTATGAGVGSPSWKMAEIGKFMNQGLINGLNEGKGQVEEAFSSVTQSLIDNANITLNTDRLRGAGASAVTGITEGISGTKSKALYAMQVVTDMLFATTTMACASYRYALAGRNIPEGIGQGINSGRNKAVTASRELANDAYRAASNIPSLYSDGLNMAEGLEDGIRAGKSGVVAAVEDMCNAAVRAARTKLDIHSPSRVFSKLGELSAEGFGGGYESKMVGVNRMIRESMDYTAERRADGSKVKGSQAQADKNIIELPIYINGVYTRTEIVEIARDGISRKQNNRWVAKGVTAGV